jgi:hypothetical protein
VGNLALAHLAVVVCMHDWELVRQEAETKAEALVPERHVGKIHFVILAKSKSFVVARRRLFSVRGVNA